MKKSVKHIMRFSLVGGAAALLTASLALGSPGNPDKSAKEETKSRSKDDKAKKNGQHTMKPGKARTNGKMKTVNNRELSQILRDWPAEPKAAVEELSKKYGQPHEATASFVMWHNNGPWKMTIVSKEMTDHHFPKPHKDFVMQVIEYDVPTDKFDELAAYDGSVTADRTRGLLSARCGEESMNILALNLANEVIEGKDVEDARLDYAKAVASVGQGETPEKTQQFQFQMPKQSGDPDSSIMNKIVTER